VQKTNFLVGFMLMLTAVLLGAFGAHGLKNIVAASQVEIFKTGVTYQFYHAFGILILSTLSLILKTNEFKSSIYLMITGIVFFSGSLYLLSLREVITFSVAWAGPITPIGGLCFAAGWLMAAIKILKKNISL
jgi:uncharacterized membrane protein YgdD (TMEM256/DUF423 family)